MDVDLSALLAAALGAGLLLGGLITWFATRQAGGGRSAAQLKDELETYKRDVAAHYAETAKRVDTLTKAYKDVYDHLEDGAYRLVGEEELRRRLDGGSEPVTLPGIGPRPLAGPPTDDVATVAPAHAGDTPATPDDASEGGATEDTTVDDTTADDTTADDVANETETPVEPSDAPSAPESTEAARLADRADADPEPGGAPTDDEDADEGSAATDDDDTPHRAP